MKPTCPSQKVRVPRAIYIDGDKGTYIHVLAPTFIQPPSPSALVSAGRGREGREGRRSYHTGAQFRTRLGDNMHKNAKIIEGVYVLTSPRKQIEMIDMQDATGNQWRTVSGRRTVIQLARPSATVIFRSTGHNQEKQATETETEAETEAG